MFVKATPNAVKSDGTLVPYEIGKGYKLAAATYYIDVSIPDAPHVSVHCSWDATIVASSLNYQSSNLPAYKSESAPYTDSSGGVDVSLFDSTAGNWLTEDPSTAYVPISGGTVTNMTIAIAGSTAGGALLDIANANHRRARMKIVVTTAGYFRCHAHGKQA